MSPKASRFHFEHYVSLQDWSPPNQVFYQNISNCLYLYQMKSNSKIIELGYTTRRTSDDAFVFFESVPKMFCFVAILHDTQQSATWPQNISRNIAILDNISCHYRYNNTLFWCCFDMKNSIFHTSFTIHPFWCPIYEKFVIMLCTKMASIIQTMIFNTTAILKTNHTIGSVNFKTRNLKGANKIYLNLD